MTVDQLLARHNRLLARQDQLRAKLKKVCDELRVTKAEFEIRGMAPRAE
jgi:hypothetical protein